MATRVVILGGGIAALTTAWRLSEPSLGGQYEVTVRTLGWRLGGKGASGRSQGRALGQVPERIEEHGLHFVFGFYENAFALIRRAYEALGRNWQSAFAADDGRITMYEELDGGWEPWSIDWPPIAGQPGEPTPPPSSSVHELLLLWLRRLRGALSPLSLSGVGAPGPALLQLDAAIEALERPSTLGIAAGGQTTAIDALRGFLGEVRHLPRRLRLLASLMGVMGLGVLRDVIPADGDWFVCDDLDLRDWLRRHGASEEVVHSAPVRGLYSAIFSDGQQVGAGTLVQALFKAALLARGAPFFRMNQGMGDAVFAPLYEALVARGVSFRFFEKVTRLERDGSHISRIHLERQARVRSGAYQPLIDVGGHRCWPAEPRWEQLVDDELTRGRPNLEDWWSGRTGEAFSLDTAPGRDGFDVAVLATSLGALPFIAEALVDDPANPRFGEMVRGVQTTQTQGVQLWFRRSAQALGWRTRTVIPFAAPLDTAADMSHLRAAEAWPTEVQSLAYLTAPLADEELPPRRDSTYPGRQVARVRANLRRWLSESAPEVWPGSTRGGQFDEGVLFGSLDDQFVVATWNPSDRYVLSNRGTHRFRLDSDESGYDNLVLAGDWTKNALSIGCLESAVMSGIRAATCIEPTSPPAVYDWLPAPRSSRARTRSTRAYLLRDGDLLAVPPVHLEVELSLFVLRADRAALQALADRQLNLGPERYAPLGPFVVFYTAKMLNLVDGLGVCPELDVGFWVPMTRTGTDQVFSFTPYLWVDNDIALVGGREVFGFPKHVATFTWEGPHRAPVARSVTAHVLPFFGPTQVVEPRRLVTMSAVPAGPGAPGVTDWAALPGLLPDLPDLARQVADFVRRPGMSMVFLKQQPHASVRNGASVRAIVESVIQLRGLPRLGRIQVRRPTRLRIARFASHDIVHRLGLKTSGALDGVDTVESIADFWFEFSATVLEADDEREVLT